MKAEDLTRRVEVICGQEIALLTYRLGDMYHCKAQSCPPEAEARIASASGPDRDTVEKQVIAEVESLLSQ